MTLSVIPAQAGIQNRWKLLDSRLRGNDENIAFLHLSTASQAGIQEHMTQFI